MCAREAIQNCLLNVIFYRYSRIGKISLKIFEMERENRTALSKLLLMEVISEWLDKKS